MGGVKSIWITSIFSAFQALVSLGYAPTEHDLEFHWYSAEEAGLFGSQDVARAYARDGKAVRAMLQVK